MITGLPGGSPGSKGIQCVFESGVDRQKRIELRQFQNVANPAAGRGEFYAAMAGLRLHPYRNQLAQAGSINHLDLTEVQDDLPGVRKQACHFFGEQGTASAIYDPTLAAD